MTLNISDFTYNKKTRTLSAEASELFRVGAMTSKFSVKSEKTGVVAEFKHSYTKLCADGDIEFFAFYNAKTNTNMVIFND